MAAVDRSLLEERLKKVFSQKNLGNDAAEMMTDAIVDSVYDDGSGNHIEILEERLDDHVSDRSNPHKVTAEQVGAYTKEETDKIIADAEENFMKNHGLIYDKGVVYFG